MQAAKNQNQDTHKAGSTLRSIQSTHISQLLFLKNKREFEQIDKINHFNNANNRDKKAEKKRNPEIVQEKDLEI